MKLLILVDVQNVYHGSRNSTEGRSRVDYERLIDVIKDKLHGLLHEELSQVTVFGYVVKTYKYKGMEFFAFLRRIGYTLRTLIFDGETPDDEDNEDARERGTVVGMMQMDFIEHAPNYDVVVVVSGSGVFVPVFEAAEANWPDVKRGIAAFDNTMHKEYERRKGLADLLIYLDDNVLRED